MRKNLLHYFLSLSLFIASQAVPLSWAGDSCDVGGADFVLASEQYRKSLVDQGRQMQEARHPNEHSFKLADNGLFGIINSARARFARGNLENNLLKNIPERGKQHVLPEEYAGLDTNRKASVSLDQKGRYDAINNLSLAEVIAAPGHYVLRNPAQIASLKKLIQEDNRPDLFSHDPLILNIITGDNGQIKFIDGWNGHHRLVAYLLAGKTNIGEIGISNLRILVNGHITAGEKWAHWLPAKGVDLAVHKDFSPVKNGDDPGTLSFDGGLSNYALGSRFTIAGIQKQSELKKLKVGVYFGSFDPLHEGHVDIAKKAREMMGLDEVILVPNVEPLHKPGITKLNHRLNMLAQRVLSEDGLNLYTGNSAELINPYGNKVFLQRLVQIYGSENIQLIQGSDSMSKLMGLGQVEADGFSHIVFPRDQESRNFQVPPKWSEWIHPVDYVSTRSTSSSEVKKRLKNGQAVDHLLHPDLVEYIKQHELYK